MASTETFSLLVVEDDLAARAIIVQMIEVRFPGCTVYTADNGREGLEVFRKENPPLVLTDINMPVMDGLEMAREIRALGPNTTFLVLTAYGDEQLEKSFTEVGFCSFLRKPVDFQELFDAIESCLVT
jgi:two-component system, sensor histidine kinase and response regulator